MTLNNAESGSESELSLWDRLQRQQDERTEERTLGSSENSEEGSEETSQESKGLSEKELADKLSKMEDKLSISQSMAQILTDPDVKAVLEAKRRGVNVEVREASSDSASSSRNPQKSQSSFSEDTTDPLADLTDAQAEELTNKDLIKLILKVVPRSTESVIDSKLSALTQDLNGIKNYLNQSVQKTVDEQIEALRKNHPDFSRFEEAMLHISKQNPGLSVEELYDVAKKRYGGVSGRETDSERPTNSAARRRDPIKMAPGKQGFSNGLAEAMDRLQLRE